MVSIKARVATASNIIVLKAILVGVMSARPIAGVDDTAARSDCASRALSMSRQNLSREIESAVADVSSSMRSSTQIIVNMTLARTEDFLDRIRNLVLEQLRMIEYCFRPLRYSLMVFSNPVCLAREGLKLQRQINVEVLRWARVVARMGQDELLIFKEERSQRVIDALSQASNRAAVPLARNLIKCVYGRRITNMLRI